MRDEALTENRRLRIEARTSNMGWEGLRTERDEAWAQNRRLREALEGWQEVQRLIDSDWNWGTVMKIKVDEFDRLQDVTRRALENKP